jgi:hypothetical protein
MKQAVVVPIDEKEFAELTALGFDIRNIKGWKQIHENTNRYVISNKTAKKIRGHKAVIRIFEHKTIKETPRGRRIL